MSKFFICSKQKVHATASFKLKSFAFTTNKSNPTRVSLCEKYKNFLDLVQSNNITCNENGSIILNQLSGGNITEIIINNPNKKNALNGRMLFELAASIDYITETPQIMGVIIKGGDNDQSKSFCSGLDFSLVKSVINTPELGEQMSLMMTDILTRLRKSGCISLALINGSAFGGGAEIATACDFRVMLTNSKICFVHASIGASPVSISVIQYLFQHILRNNN